MTATSATAHRDHEIGIFTICIQKRTNVHHKEAKEVYKPLHSFLLACTSP